MKEIEKNLKNNSYKIIINNLYEILKKRNIKKIYILFPINNSYFSKFITELNLFLKIKGIETEKFKENNINKNVPLLTYGSPYGTPINESNSKYPNFLFIIGLSLHSGIISKNIGIYEFKGDKYIKIKKENIFVKAIYKQIYKNRKKDKIKNIFEKYKDGIYIWGSLFFLMLILETNFNIKYILFDTIIITIFIYSFYQLYINNYFNKKSKLMLSIGTIFKILHIIFGIFLFIAGFYFLGWYFFFFLVFLIYFGGN